MKRGMGSHQNVRGITDTWLTPREIVDAFGPFDMDPCAAPNPRPWPTGDGDGSGYGSGYGDGSGV